MITDSRPIWDAPLAEILSQPAMSGTRASATDIPGVNLEWMATDAYPQGAWFGDCGQPTLAQLNALPTAYLALGARASVLGVQYTYGAGGWAEAGGVSFARIKSASSRKTTSFLLNVSNGFNATYAYQAVVPSSVLAVRIAIASGPNAETWIARAGMQASYASGFGGLSSGLSSLSTWNGGDGSVTIPASSPSATYRVPYVWSDWVSIPDVARTDAGPGRIVTILAYKNAATNNHNAKSEVTNDQYLSVSPYTYRTSLAVGDFVTSNPSGFGSSVPSNNVGNPIVGFEYLTSDNLISFVEYGDSISCGYAGEKSGFGLVWRLADSLTADGILAVGRSLGIPGGGSFSFNEQMHNDMLGSTSPKTTFALMRAFTRNDGGLGIETVTKRCGRARIFVERCRELGIIPALLTGMYESATVANNTYAVATNAGIIALGAEMNVPVLDLWPAFDSGNAAAYLGDGIHPNAAGQVHLVDNYYKPFALSLISRYL